MEGDGRGKATKGERRRRRAMKGDGREKAVEGELGRNRATEGEEGRWKSKLILPYRK